MSNEPSPRARDSKEERAHSDSLCARFSPSISLLLSQFASVRHDETTVHLPVASNGASRSRKGQGASSFSLSLLKCPLSKQRKESLLFSSSFSKKKLTQVKALSYSCHCATGSSFSSSRHGARESESDETG